MPIYEVKSANTEKTYRVETEFESTEEALKSRIYYQELRDKSNQRFPEGLNPEKYDSKDKKEEVSSFTQALYGFSSADNDLDLASTWLEAEFPIIDNALSVIPGIESGAQKYGIDFLGLNPEEKRARVAEYKEQELRRDYPEIYEAGMQDEGGIAGGVGSFVGMIASPTSLIPVGATTKMGAVGIGALLGGVYGGLSEKSRSSDVDFGNVAKSVALGAGISLAGHTLVKAVQRRLKPKTTEEDIRKSGEIVDDANQELLDDAVKEVYEVEGFGRLGGSPVEGADYRPIREILAEQRSAGTVLPSDASTAEIVRAHRKSMLTGEPFKIAKDPRPKPTKIEERTGRSKEELGAASVESGKPYIDPSAAEVKAVGNVGSAGITPNTKATNSGLARYIESMSTQIGRISKPIQLALRRVDVYTHAKVAERQQKVMPFTRFWNGGMFTKSISPADKALVTKYLYNGDAKSVEKIIAGYGDEVMESYDGVRKVFDEMFVDLKSGYKDVTKVENYWHRSIKDWKGLQKALGKEETDLFEQLLDKEAKRLRASGKLGKGETLPQQERERVFNAYFRGFRGNFINEKTLTAAQKRKIEQLDDSLTKFYDDPIVALHKYIDEGTSDHARKVFFGNAARVTGEGTFVTEGSVGALVDGLVRKKNITPQQADELAELLKIRFVNGEKSASNLVQGFRNVGYLTTLANPFAAAIQLADIGVSAYANGLRNTIASMITPKNISMKELGLDRVIAEEFKNEKFLAKTLHKAFTASGFRHIDRFGKDVVLNAALRKGRIGALKNNSKFGKQLESKYKKAFGNEYEALVSELKSGQMTERVKLYLWSELADVQPVSLSEMPIKYLEMKNGRLLYMLKTWTAKQLDLMRRDIRDEYANGNKKQAISNAISYSLIIPSFGVGANYVKDSMLGRDPGLDEIEPMYIDSALRMVGASAYLVGRVSEADTGGDKLKETLRPFAPPYQHIVDAADALGKAVNDDNPNWNRVIRHAPVVGRFYYNFFGGGLENHYKYKD